MLSHVGRPNHLFYCYGGCSKHVSSQAYVKSFLLFCNFFIIFETDYYAVLITVVRSSAIAEIASVGVHYAV